MAEIESGEKREINGPEDVRRLEDFDQLVFTPEEDEDREDVFAVRELIRGGKFSMARGEIPNIASTGLREALLLVLEAEQVKSQGEVKKPLAPEQPRKSLTAEKFGRNRKERVKERSKIITE